MKKVGFQFCFEGGKRSCISYVGRERGPDNMDLILKRSLAKPFELEIGNSDTFFVAVCESARRLIDGESRWKVGWKSGRQVLQACNQF